MTDILITDSSGNVTGTIYWDEVTNRLVMESTEGINLLSNNNGDITLTPTGTTTTIINGLYFPRNDGTHGQVMVTDGAGNLSFITLPTNTSISMSDLSDVKYPNGVDEGYLLVYSVADSAWVATVPPTTTMSLSDLDDVSYPNGVDNGYVLEYSTTDGGWIAKVPMSGTDISLEDLNDVAYPNGVDDGFILEYSVANSEWQAVQPPDYNVDLDELNDVEITNPIQADTLQYDALTRMWKNIQPEAVDLNASLDQLNDVTITNVQVGQGITWDGSLWVNTDLASGSGNVDSVFGRTGVVTAEGGDYASFYAPIVHTHTVSNITDLTTYYYDKTTTNSLLNNKTNLVTGTVGNFAELDGLGQLQDSQSNYSSFATWQQGALADSALQPGNNISLLTNDSGYITAADIPSSSVSSVFGRTGAVTAELSDYSLFYTQPGENISIFNNDAGYITAADIPPGAGVASFAGRSGIVVPVGTDYASFYATTAQGILADSALQPNDNITELTNNAGYITAAQIPINPATTAPMVAYSNTVSGLAATDVQAAIDEIDAIVDLNTAARHTHVNKSVLDSITSAGSGQIITVEERTSVATAIQPGDNITELANNAGYITAADIPPGSGVTTFNGRSGVVVPLEADYSAYFATNEQGVLADSALQPNDNISELNNDSGYITLAQVPADVVPSVFGRTGAVTAELSDYSLFYTQPGEDISVFNNDAGYITAADIPPGSGVASFNGRSGVVVPVETDYSAYFATNEQGVLASTAIQPNDNISELTNDSGYITAADIPPVPTAADVTYDNTASGLAATNVQAALDEIDTAVDLNTAARHTHLNKSVLDGITDAGSGQIITIQERTDLATAIQPGDNITELTNNANYITLAQVPADAPTDLTTGYASNYVFVYSSTGADTTITAATSVQAGVMSNTDKVTLDSALQSGDNVSELTNDSGYITLAEVPIDVVTSVFNRTGDVLATAGDYDAFYYTEAETDSQIAASMTAHVNAANPHPQYLTAEDLPETRPAWYTKVVSSIDPAFYVSANVKPTTPETSVSAIGDNTGVPVRLGQWMPPAAYAQAFDFYETALTFQYDIDCTTNDAEIYVEVWLRRAAGGETLLATGNRIPLTSDRQTYSGSLIIPGPVSVAVGDITFSRMYLNKTGGTDPTATLYMEGNNLTRMIITQPIPSYPAPHAFTHEVGGTDQIDHSQIAGAFGYKTHAEIDAELATALQPSDNISVLTNDSGYITLAQVPADAVSSVFGRTGAVTADADDYSAYYAPTTATVYAEDTVQVVTTPSSVNIATGGFLTYTATGANTWNFTVPSTAGKAIGWTLELTNGGTGVQTFTGVTWAAGSAPTLVASGVNVLVFTKNNVTGVIRGYVAA